MKTVKSSIEVQGNGLMTGVDATVIIEPSETPNINFFIGDTKITADPNNVVSTEHCVVLGDFNNLMGPKVALVEHLMASFAITGIDGVNVRFKNPNYEVAKLMQNAFEIPILDGSARIWVKKLNEAGFVGDENKTPTLNNTINFQKGNSFVTLTPSEGDTRIIYCVNYDHPDLQNVFATSDNIEEVTSARTFGYLKDLDKLQAMGFSRGVTIDNTVGLKDVGYTTELRSVREPNKHKILDIIGDLRLSGVNPFKIKANVIACCAGHFMHVEACKLLKEVL